MFLLAIHLELIINISLFPLTLQEIVNRFHENCIPGILASVHTLT